VVAAVKGKKYRNVEIRDEVYTVVKIDLHTQEVFLKPQSKGHVFPVDLSTFQHKFVLEER
jgi:hypothetical protein